MALERSFNVARRDAFLDTLARLPAQVRNAAARTSVSVVVPVVDDAAPLDETLRSIRSQSHRRIEIIVVDATADGKLDASALGDPADEHQRLVHSRSAGLAGARVAGLRSATGEIVAHLDPGALWEETFLETMVHFLVSRDLASGHAIARLIGGPAGVCYQGAEHDGPDDIVLNTLIHRRDPFSGVRPPWSDARFVRRVLDQGPRGFAPIVGCAYRGAAALDRLAPSAGRREADGSLHLAIKIAAAQKQHYRWGDFHFAAALKASFERLGHRARIDFVEDWYGPQTRNDDAAIVLRGPVAYQPQPTQLNVLWTISHPETVTYQEYDAYQLVYVASQSYAAFLKTFVPADPRVLLQASDPARFRPSTRKSASAHDALFVGNSRGEYRDIVRWAIEASLEPAIYGAGWESFVGKALVKGDYLANQSLGSAYASARLLLCDHFPAMRDFGFISNRVFDGVASGATLVCDHIPSIERLFPSSVHMVRSSSELRGVARSLHTPADAGRRRAEARKVAARHSFDARARVLAGDVGRLLAAGGTVRKPGTRQPGSGGERPGLRVHLVVGGRAGRPDDAAFVRLVSPLTSDACNSALTVAGDVKENARTEADIAIVQCAAVLDSPQPQALADRLIASPTPFILDIDRAPAHRRRDAAAAALERLAGKAAQCWVATVGLSERYGAIARAVHVVPSSLDPRVWRDYAPVARPRDGRALRLLHIARGRDATGSEMLVDALDLLASRSDSAFELVCAGDVGGFPSRPWLTAVQSPPSAGLYPQFAQWLRFLEPFDIGLALSTASAGDGTDIRLLEYAALGAIPIASDRPAYRDDPNSGDFAVFARNTAEDWASALATTLETADRTDPSAAQAYLWAQRNTAGVANTATRLLSQASRPLRDQA